MIKKLYLFAMAWTIVTTSLAAQENVKLMFYNILNFPSEDAVTNRLQYLELILDDYRPDLFMVCELNNESGADTILNSLQYLNPNYDRAVFEFNTSDDTLSDQNDLQQMLFFDSSKFILESQTPVTTIFRDFNHYKLRLNTVDQNTNPIILDVIVCHLKASSGSANQASRLQMVNDLQTYLDTFPTDSNVVLAGDLNVYTNSEPAFIELIDATNNITFVDPANRIGSWHNNPNFIDVMTQSTRTQTGLGGSTGGFDDRFDFIMTSDTMVSNPELSFVSGSYDVYGNNENFQCYNQEINSSDCSGSDYPFFIRDALYLFSDHLPVLLELQTNQSLSIPEFVSENIISFRGTNVVDDLIELKIKPDYVNDLSLVIYNSYGQSVRRVNVNSSLITLETAALSSGIYYIANSKSKFKPLKFIVAH